MLRPAVFIPEAKPLNVLLRDFRANRNHMAIVVDEYGGVAGLITIEDVLEQIVGDIEDEYDFDEEADAIVAEPDGRYRVKALAEITAINTTFGTTLSAAEFDTIGGLITDQLGRVPKRGDVLEIDGLRFEVLRADARQVHLFQVARLPKTVAREFEELEERQGT
jgi:magnesium and cobalt transporter